MSAATDEVNYAGVYSTAKTEQEKKIIKKSKTSRKRTKEEMEEDKRAL